MLHRCTNCPGTIGLQTLLKSKPEGIILENDESIVHKQWVSTDRTPIAENIKPISEYLIIIHEIKITMHHFIAKTNQTT